MMLTQMQNTDVETETEVGLTGFLILNCSTMLTMTPEADADSEVGDRFRG